MSVMLSSSSLSSFLPSHLLVCIVLLLQQKSVDKQFLGRAAGQELSNVRHVHGPLGLFGFFRWAGLVCGQPQKTEQVHFGCVRFLHQIHVFAVTGDAKVWIAQNLAGQVLANLPALEREKGFNVVFNVGQSRLPRLAICTF